MKLFILYILFFSLANATQSYIISGGKNNTIQTIASKILKKAYTRAKIDAFFTFVQLEKSLKLSNSGKSDGEMARIKKVSNIYPNLLIVPVPLISIQAIAYSEDENIKISSWNDLKKYKFTIIKGIKFIEKKTKNMKKNVVLTFEDAFYDLEKGKTQIVVATKLASLEIIYKNNYRDIKAVSNSLKSLDLYHFVNKKNKKLIPILTPILQKMKKTGEMSYIKDSHLLSITIK